MKNIKRKAFTLAEILVILVIGSFILTFVYRMLSHGFSYFFKSQAKLTNLRTANIIIEQFKSDIRAAYFSKEGYSLSEDGHSVSFAMKNKSTESKQIVKYSFDETTKDVTRSLDGANEHSITGKVKIVDLTFSDNENDNDQQNGESKGKSFVIKIKVDKDNDLPTDTRTQSSKGNVVTLKTVLYPKFFAENQTDEEKFWNAARKEIDDDD